MTKKRLEEILWEKNNAPEKFKLHGWEYFEEALPMITELVCEKPEKVEKKKK